MRLTILVRRNKEKTLVSEQVVVVLEQGQTQARFILNLFLRKQVNLLL